MVSKLVQKDVNIADYGIDAMTDKGRVQLAPNKKGVFSADTYNKMIDPKSEEYYSEIDKRIRVAFPQKFGNNSTQETTKPVQNVASAKRSNRGTGRKTVKLTSSQVAIAKKLGVPLEEYAKHLNVKE